MKKLLFILIALPMIGFGQDITYSDLIMIKDIRNFEKIMYEKGMRYISSANYYTYWPRIKTNTGWVRGDFEYGTTEFEPTAERYTKSKQNHSGFGRNYNSKTETAEAFYKMRERSKFQNYSSLIDKTLDNSGFSLNYIKFELQFPDKSEYDNFWNTINIPLEYSHTNKYGGRIYKYNNIECEIIEYDNMVTIEITNNL